MRDHLIFCVLLSLDTQDGAIKLMEFSSESEYWTFAQKFNRCFEGDVQNTASGSCVFSSNAGNSAGPHVANGESYKWSLESSGLLKVTDNRGMTSTHSTLYHWWLLLVLSTINYFWVASPRFVVLFDQFFSPVIRQFILLITI